jgi:hypothetical protein
MSLLGRTSLTLRFGRVAAESGNSLGCQAHRLYRRRLARFLTRSVWHRLDLMPFPFFFLLAFSILYAGTEVWRPLSEGRITVNGPLLILDRPPLNRQRLSEQGGPRYSLVRTGI